MHYQEGQDRNQMYVTSLEEMVAADRWARIVDLFVECMPLNDFGFKNMELNKEDDQVIIPPQVGYGGPVDLQASEPRSGCASPKPVGHGSQRG